MNRIAKLVCWLAIGEMIAVAIGAYATRWDDIIHHPRAISFFGWRIIVGLVIFPAFAAFEVARTGRRLQPSGMILSDGYRRLRHFGVIAACLLMAGVETWFAAILAARHGLWYGSPQQVTMLIGGAVIVALGNASAKVAPPTGPAAPEPGAWIRGSLRNGWAVVICGLVMMVAAFAPVSGRVIASLAVLPLAISAGLSQRRLLRGGGPRAPA